MVQSPCTPASQPNLVNPHWKTEFFNISCHEVEVDAVIYVTCLFYWLQICTFKLPNLKQNEIYRFTVVFCEFHPRFWVYGVLGRTCFSMFWTVCFVRSQDTAGFPTGVGCNRHCWTLLKPHFSWNIAVSWWWTEYSVGSVGEQAFFSSELHILKEREKFTRGYYKPKCYCPIRHANLIRMA